MPRQLWLTYVTSTGQSAQAASVVSEEVISEELADWEAEHEPGGHWAIRNRDIRGFWWTAFAGKDEMTWDRFWVQFPKHLRDKCAYLVQSIWDAPACTGNLAALSQDSAGLHQLPPLCRSVATALRAVVHTKVNRDILQAKATRGSPQIVTPVEMDFVYPPFCDIASVTQFAIQADTLWLELQRCALLLT